MAKEQQTERTTSNASGERKAKLVQFRKNRSFELYVARKMISFGPHEEKRLPTWVIEHDDFRQVAHLFAIKE